MKYVVENLRSELTGWNLAPLIGVLVALIVVLMAATPAPTGRIELTYRHGCGLCFDGRCRSVDELRVVVGDNGLVSINGVDMAAAEIPAAVRWTDAPGARVFVAVQVQPEATFGEATEVLAQLRRVGIPETSLHVSGLSD